MKSAIKRRGITLLVVFMEFILIISCYGGVFYSFFQSSKLSKLSAVLGFLISIYFLLVVGPVADSRFRTLFTPYLYLVGCGGIYHFVRRKKIKNEKWEIIPLSS